MIGNISPNRIKKYATREMLQNESKHAIYGLAYVNLSGSVVEKFASTPDKIKYFYTDKSFSHCVHEIKTEYGEMKDVNVYAVHRKDYL